MESVIRAAVVYLFLLVVFRIAGKRSLAQITTFDFVLLLIIGEATQQALLGEDYSLVNAGIVIATLIVLEIALSYGAARFRVVDRAMEGLPLLLVDHGRVLKDRLKRERLDESEILTAARELHGLERLEDVKYAVLERSGGISIVPRQNPSVR
jgi:uncharacterized membrane protein YcaP (DUF421 family)